MLGTVTKAVRVLEVFSEESDWGVSEVARELGMPKSSAHSLLTTLADTGLLRRTPDNRYRLGGRVLALSRCLLDGSDLRNHARSTMTLLVRQFGLVVHLATLDDGAVTYLDKAQPSPAEELPMTGVGRRLPSHCTALGKVLLANEPESYLDDLSGGCRLPRYTNNTICDVEELRAELSVVRRRGYSTADEELIPGVSCFAAPVTGIDGHVDAAVSVTLPTQAYRRAPERWSKVAVGAAARISRSIQSGEAVASPAVDRPIAMAAS